MILIGLDQRTILIPSHKSRLLVPSPWVFGFGRGHTPSDHSILQAMCEAYRHPNKMGFLLPKGEGRRSGEGSRPHALSSEGLSLLWKHHFSIFYRSLWSLGSSIPVSFIQNVHEFLCGFFVVFTWCFARSSPNIYRIPVLFFQLHLIWIKEPVVQEQHLPNQGEPRGQIS